MPPVGCWIFLTLESITNCPPAITAPDSVEVAAHRPIVPPNSAIRVVPDNARRRSFFWCAEALTGAVIIIAAISTNLPQRR